ARLAPAAGGVIPACQRVGAVVIAVDDELAVPVAGLEHLGRESLAAAMDQELTQRRAAAGGQVRHVEPGRILVDDRPEIAHAQVLEVNSSAVSTATTPVAGVITRAEVG